MFEREIRTLAFVPRWAIVRVNRQQNVAEHSFFVAIYADMIADMVGWQGPRDALLRHALFHDMDEILTGDISAPSKKVMEGAAGVGYHVFEKWKSQQMKRRIASYDCWLATHPDAPGLDGLSAILLVADLLEAVLFLADESFSGNHNVSAVLAHCEDKLIRSIDGLPGSEGVRSSVASAIRAAIGVAGSRCDIVVTGKEAVA